MVSRSYNLGPDTLRNLQVVKMLCPHLRTRQGILWPEREFHGFEGFPLLKHWWGGKISHIDPFRFLCPTFKMQAQNLTAHMPNPCTRVSLQTDLTSDISTYKPGTRALLKSFDYWINCPGTSEVCLGPERHSSLVSQTLAHRHYDFCVSLPVERE